MNNKEISVGTVITHIRNSNHKTRENFGQMINRHRNWVYLKERNKSKIYISDFAKILKLFNYDILFKSEKYQIKLYLLDHSSANILRFMREATGKTQKEFSNSISKTNDWSYTNEAGINNYYANDLFELAKIHDFEIILIEIE